MENKRLITEHYNIDRVLADFGIRVIGKKDVWEEPTGTNYEYGDAYVVGETEPYVIYIYTRADELHPEPYWLNIGSIAVEGP